MLSNLVSSVAISSGGNSIISNNRVQGGVIRANGSNVTIMGNRVISSVGGITVFGASTKEVIISGNYCETTGTAPPIDCSTSGQELIAITGNRTIGGNNGIRVRAKSTCTGNIVIGTGNGIRAESTGSVVTGNFITAGTPISEATPGTNTTAGNVGPLLPLNIIGYSGTPEAAVTARIGSILTTSGGGAGTTLYVKESGTGNTGWAAK
jgi:hypothetical protein